VQVIVVLNDHAGTELGRWNRHCWFTSPYSLLGILGSGGADPQLTGAAAARWNQHFILHRRGRFWEPGSSDF
jgi:hypothetical protein